MAQIFIPPAPARNPQNDLNGLIQGLQAGQAIQQMPQQLQNNQINQMLQQALLREKLLDLQDPNRAIVRQFSQDLARQASLGAATGVVPAIKGFETEVVSQPGTVSVDEVTGAITPVKPAGAPITPFVVGGIPTGFASDPVAQAAEQKRLADLKRINDKTIFSPLGMTPDGKNTIVYNHSTGKNELQPIPQAEGQTSPIVSLPGKGGKATSNRELTQNARNALFTAAGTFGLNADDPLYHNAETGVYDFTRLAIDTGKAKSAAKLAENRAKAAEKANALVGEQKTYLGKLDAADLQLNVLQRNIEELSQSGSNPGLLDSMIATATSAPATGWWSGLVKQGLKTVQSDESKKLEGKKAIISSALYQAISGLAVTEGEARRTAPFLPLPEDSFHDLVIKAGLLEEYINNQRSGILSGPSRGGGSTPEQNSTNAPSGTPAPIPSSGKKVGRFTLLP